MKKSAAFMDYEGQLLYLHQNLYQQLHAATSLEQHLINKFLFGIVDDELNRIHGFCTCPRCGELLPLGEKGHCPIL